MRMMSRLAVLLMIAAFSLGLAGCGEEGSAEKAGRKIDNAIEQFKEDAKDAGEKFSDDLEEAKEKAKKAME